MIPKRLFILASSFLFLYASCASSSKNEVRIQHFYLYNLHARRPAVKGATAGAYPDWEDFKPTSPPGPNYDCQRIQDLFKDVDLKSLRECLIPLHKDPKGLAVHYRLRREPAPYWELEQEETTPVCLRQALPTIPVPREIFFQSEMSTDRIECFSSRLNIEADEFFGLKVPIAGVQLEINFPMQRPIPESDAATRILLSTWSVTPFFDPESHTIPSKLVPEPICRTCFADKDLYFPADATPVIWP